MKTIAYTTWDKQNTIFYVSDIKGKKGDWGYTNKSNKAIDLSVSQQKRFTNDCKFCGRQAQFLTIK